MADITSASTISTLGVTSAEKVVKVVTPATADDGDVVDLSSYFSVGCFSVVHGATDGVLLAQDAYTDKQVTLPGVTDNEVRTIIARGQ